MLINPQVSNTDPTSVGWGSFQGYFTQYLDMKNYTCQHGLPSKTRTASKGKILCQSQLQSPYSLPKNEQLHLDVLSGRLTSSSGLATLRSISQLFGTKVILLWWCIAITSWSPDVVNLVCPKCVADAERNFSRKRNVCKFQCLHIVSCYGTLHVFL